MNPNRKIILIADVIPFLYLLLANAAESSRSAPLPTTIGATGSSSVISGNAG